MFRDIDRPGPGQAVVIAVGQHQLSAGLRRIVSGLAAPDGMPVAPYGGHPDAPRLFIHQNGRIPYALGSTQRGGNLGIINGDFDIDMIMSKTKRKKVKSFKLSEADLAAPLDSHRMDYYNGNQKMKEYDFSSGIEDHKRYAMIIRDSGETCKVILELDDALANTMKNSAPSKVFLD